MIISLQDIGQAQVALEGVSQTVDVVAANNKLGEIQAKHDKDANAGNEAVLDYMVELGFPRCSHFIACAFATHIAERMKTLQDSLKNVGSGESKVGSPASTASTPSDSARQKS